MVLTAIIKDSKNSERDSLVLGSKYASDVCKKRHNVSWKRENSWKRSDHGRLDLFASSPHHRRKSLKDVLTRFPPGKMIDDDEGSIQSLSMLEVERPEDLDQSEGNLMSFCDGSYTSFDADDSDLRIEKLTGDLDHSEEDLAELSVQDDLARELEPTESEGKYIVF
jgi:hypothetical protein